MASSGNFPTFNPLKYKASSYTTSTISNGNMKLPSGTGNASQLNIGFVNGDGKFYFECYINSIGGSVHIGVCVGNADLNNVTSGNAIVGVRDSGEKLVPSSSSSNSSSTSYGASFTTGDYIACAIDFTSSTFILYKNNSSQGSFSWSGANDGTTYYPYIYCNSGAVTLNCGQDGTFLGVTTGGNADENGFGDFKYSPPSTYLAMCSGNLPISADIDPAGDDGETENPTKQFNAVAYTGNATTGQAITGLGFQPDLVWAKMRSSTQSNFLSNTSRGINKFLFSDLTNAEGTGGGYDSVYSSFDSDGFTFSTSGSGPNDNGRTYVAWCWRAGGTTTATNSAGAGATPTSGSVKIDGSNLGSALAGTIPANTISANTKGGFSIITYTGTGSSGTVAHGLNNAPAFVLVKKYSASGNNWCIFHQGLASANTSRLFFTSAGRDSGGASSWNSTAPSSSVISLGTNGNVNTNGEDYLIYAWSEIEGYSKFSSYTGNGNADGPFVYTGGRPSLIAIKKTSASNDWVVTDTARNTGNPASNVLRWDSTTAESSSNREIDVISNGFKPRTTNDVYNGSGGTYIYMCWNSVPFKYNNTF